MEDCLEANEQGITSGSHFIAQSATCVVTVGLVEGDPWINPEPTRDYSRWSSLHQDCIAAKKWAVLMFRRASQ